MDTEDKQAWCDYGSRAEQTFAIGRLFDLGLSGAINLEKRSNPYTHDLFVNFPVDLKTVRTPLFKAMDLYGLDPQYTITFNEKDGKRYRSLYPNIIVIFDIDWDSTEMNIDGRVYRVNPMKMTVAGFLDDIRQAIEKSGKHKIVYQRRLNDEDGNAKQSWVLDARHLQSLGK
jgi:hypothetical protein